MESSQKPSLHRQLGAVRRVAASQVKQMPRSVQVRHLLGHLVHISLPVSQQPGWHTQQLLLPATLNLVASQSTQARALTQRLQVQWHLAQMATLELTSQQRSMHVQVLLTVRYLQLTIVLQLVHVLASPLVQVRQVTWQWGQMVVTRLSQQPLMHWHRLVLKLNSRKARLEQDQQVLGFRQVQQVQLQARHYLLMPSSQYPFRHMHRTQMADRFTRYRVEGQLRQISELLHVAHSYMQVWHCSMRRLSYMPARHAQKVDVLSQMRPRVVLQVVQKSIEVQVEQVYWQLAQLTTPLSQNLLMQVQVLLLLLYSRRLTVLLHAEQSVAAVPMHLQQLQWQLLQKGSQSGAIAYTSRRQGLHTQSKPMSYLWLIPQHDAHLLMSAQRWQRLLSQVTSMHSRPPWLTQPVRHVQVRLMELYCRVEGQVRHCVSMVPEHVAHEMWQATQSLLVRQQQSEQLCCRYQMQELVENCRDCDVRMKVLQVSAKSQQLMPVWSVMVQSHTLVKMVPADVVPIAPESQGMVPAKSVTAPMLRQKGGKMVVATVQQQKPQTVTYWSRLLAPTRTVTSQEVANLALMLSVYLKVLVFCFILSMPTVLNTMMALVELDLFLQPMLRAMLLSVAAVEVNRVVFSRSSREVVISRKKKEVTAMQLTAS